MKIEKAEVWRVDGRSFLLESDAQNYLDKQEEQTKKFEANLHLIGDADKNKAIAFQKENLVYHDKDNEFSFLVWDDDQWRDCPDNTPLFYLSQNFKIKFITPGEFIKGFSSCEYEFENSSYFGRFIKEAARMNTLAGDILSTEEFAEVLSRVEIQPF